MKAYDFARSAVRKKTTPKYVKKQMREFIRTCDGKDAKYMISEAKVKQLENILKLLIMPKGLKAGKSLYECTCGYQWLFYTAILCTVHRDNPSRRRYETGVLEICRKNFKTYTIATVFILLFLTEPQYSKFYSIAPDGALSREIREAIAETIRSSPLIYEHRTAKRFKILRDYIQFRPTQTQYIPLSYSTSRMDGRLPNAFCADEVGALPISYPIEAMRSGQLNILNKLGFIISTKYPSVTNPFEDEVAYSKRVLDGLTADFAPGTMTAILGETGAGKTTLIRLILALVRPTQGRVTIYDASREIEVSPLTRGNLIYVPQGNTLFSGSIRENLLLGRPDASDEELWQVLETACADFVERLPDKLETLCSEKGGGLSEGQAQRIAIARSLLRTGSVLLLDEATSALDPETERRLLHNVAATQRGKTVIFITHRPSVLEYCDHVLRIDS